MSDLTAPVGGADAVVSVPVVTPASADNSPITASEAARQLSAFRWKRDNPTEAAKPDETPAAPVEAAAPELAETPTDAQETPDPVEPTETPEPAEPPIERPRSWTKDEDAEWQSLPRAMQQKIVAREQERDTGLRRSQNEAAEARKAVEADRVKAEQVRQEYEKALPALLQTLQTAQSGEFADIKNQDDVNKLANEDWPRFARWQAHMMQVASVEKEVKATQERQQTEFKKSWTDYAAKQDQLLNERAPELADKSKAEKVAKAAEDVLSDLGFTKQELGQAWNGEASLSLRDHRLQLLILDAVKYREAKAGVKPAPKPVPPVQRPGVSKAPTSAADADIQNLQKRFERTGDMRDAAALLRAQRRAG